MVLRGPDAPPPSERTFIPVWDAILPTQTAVRDSYWLITQPDHATLAGALAANFVSPDFPSVSPAAVRGIDLHDAGWAIFDGAAGDVRPTISHQGKPLAFHEMPADVFIRAWTGSIDAALQASALAGLLVSGHFRRLAANALQFGRTDVPPEAISHFITTEQQRAERLQSELADEVNVDLLTDVLQFCDLLSLYLCCGTAASVVFPQRFSGREMRLAPRDGAFFLDPSPFRLNAEPVPALRVLVSATRWPSGEVRQFQFLLG